MTYRHYWLQRITFSTAFIVAVGLGWFLLRNHDQLAVRVPVASDSASAGADTTDIGASAVQRSTQPTPVIAPSVQHIGNNIQLALDPKPYKKVQRVEFYVENDLVGVAFSAPYSVTISLTDLAGGNHSASAKVYTGGTVTHTVATSFDNTGSLAGNAVSDDTTRSTTSATTNTDTAPGMAAAPAAPSDVSATVGTDGVSADISWTGVGQADSYQVWRDGVQIAVMQAAAYHDTDLQPSQTYDYQIIAVAGDRTSRPSDIGAVTMPSGTSVMQSQQIAAPSAGSEPQDMAQPQASTTD